MKLSNYRRSLQQKELFDFETFRINHQLYQIVTDNEEQAKDFLSNLEAHYPYMRTNHNLGRTYYRDYTNDGGSKPIYFIENERFSVGSKIKSRGTTIYWRDYC